MTAPASPDAYLDVIADAPTREALQRLRRTIQEAAPQAEECISYGLPAFRQGKVLLAYGASTKHCALYPMSPQVIEELREELERFEISKGTIRFSPDRPLPKALIRKIVRARLREISAPGKSRDPR